MLVYMIQLFDQQAVYVYVAVFVAMAFGIANVLMMAIYERIREIGILMAIGMSRRRLVASIEIFAEQVEDPKYADLDITVFALFWQIINGADAKQAIKDLGLCDE